tara:strand:- start:61 stop:219 length:159 start_codon:yes stop_codon:yes gene_type:complete
MVCIFILPFFLPVIGLRPTPLRMSLKSVIVEESTILRSFTAGSEALLSDKYL